MDFILLNWLFNSMTARQHLQSVAAAFSSGSYFGAMRFVATDRHGVDRN